MWRRPENWIWNPARFCFAHGLLTINKPKVYNFIPLTLLDFSNRIVIPESKESIKQSKLFVLVNPELLSGNQFNQFLTKVTDKDNSQTHHLIIFSEEKANMRFKIKNFRNLYRVSDFMGKPDLMAEEVKRRARFFNKGITWFFQYNTIPLF